jgi:thymidylate synthase
MYISADTLDDLLRHVFSKLLTSNSRVDATKGENRERIGVLLELKNPTARLSRSEVKGKIFSCLGDLLWYLSGSDRLRLIKYYIKEYAKSAELDHKTIYGAYGPRLFNMRREGINQVDNVLSLLRKNPHTRRATIQLFDAGDIVADIVGPRHEDIPCTCTLQLFSRNGYLHMLTSMRSNDAFKGLPHDVFAFTMLQEIFATTLSLKLGNYKHAVGSLHLYEDSVHLARQYLQEGYQSTIPMPMMPEGDPWTGIRWLRRAEASIRNGSELKLPNSNVDPYWADLARLLQIYAYRKHKSYGKISAVRKQMVFPMYDAYIRYAPPPAKRGPDTEQLAWLFSNKGAR